MEHDTRRQRCARATCWTTYESPLGPLTLVGTDDGLTSLGVGGLGVRHRALDPDAAHFAEVCEQLEEYFVGTRRQFDLRLDLAGTAFERRAWDGLRTIPYGTTRPCWSLTDTVARPFQVRAVAAAIARTPVPIVVPRHRVVAADRRLFGSAGPFSHDEALRGLEAEIRIDPGQEAARALPPRALAWRLRPMPVPRPSPTSGVTCSVPSPPTPYSPPASATASTA
jgi:O-6-methylguanine DNA methyltransferase